jgi:hypothetical protein
LLCGGQELEEVILCVDLKQRGPGDALSPSLVFMLAYFKKHLFVVPQAL